METRDYTLKSFSWIHRAGPKKRDTPGDAFQNYPEGVSEGGRKDQYQPVNSPNEESWGNLQVVQSHDSSSSDNDEGYVPSFLSQTKPAANPGNQERK